MVFPAVVAEVWFYTSAVIKKRLYELLKACDRLPYYHMQCHDYSDILTWMSFFSIEKQAVVSLLETPFLKTCFYI